MEFQIVPMNRSHLPHLAAIELACFSMPWTEQMLAEELSNERALYLVAQGKDGAVLGYAGLQTVLDEGYITNIAVAPSFRRQGVADGLLRAVIQFGQTRRLAFLTLEVRASNQPAISLYQKHGFTQSGRRKGYYDHPIEDAILMTLRF